MRRPTLDTAPLSYSKTLQPSRAGEASALTTGLGSVSFVGLDICRLPSGSLVSQHMLKRGPARIQNGFRHSGFSKLRRAHITHDDQTVCVCQPSTGDMEMVSARVGDLRGYGARSSLVPSTLSFAQRALVLPIVAKRRDLIAVTARRERLQAEIDTDLPRADWQVIRDIALEAGVPTAACVLDKGPGLEDSVDVARPPKAEALLQINGSITIYANGARNKWDPPKRSLGAKASAKVRASSMHIARGGELAADGIDCVGMQPEISGTPYAKSDQLKGRWPSCRQTRFAAFLGLPLRCNAEVPHLITCNGMTIEVLPGAGILDAKFECEDAHFGSVLVPSGPIKNASSAGKPSARSLFVSDREHNINEDRRG